MESEPSICTFESTGFASLSDPIFRLTEGDRVPALAIRLDGSEAVVPLKAVAKLFDIVPGSADGNMLQLVAQSLRFVAALRIGDKLPAEVLTGEASWKPTAYHTQVASARLQLKLLNWASGQRDGEPVSPHMLVVSMEDPAIRPRLQDALRRATDELSLESGSFAVSALIEEWAGELAFIEALRERLLVRVQTLYRRLLRFSQDGSAIATARRETLVQVVRLAAIGLAQVTGRFEQVDAQTGEIISALRNLEQQRTFIRPNRDWLYCTQMAWHPILQEWESLPPGLAGERVWRALDVLYRFLAPRHMAVQQWQNMMSTQGQPVEKSKASYVW